jgi:hypothetical protein
MRTASADIEKAEWLQRIGRGVHVTAMAITDEHLRALSSEQRAHLARRLAALSQGTGRTPARRRLTAVLALGACVAMVPWTVMLAFTLPDRYVAHHWSTTWVGFDILLVAAFAATGVTALRRRRGQALWAATLVTATLLTCDAWFDITTASTTSSLVSSLVTATAGNLPLAGLMVYLGYRSLRHSSVVDKGRSPLDRPADSR